MTTTLDALTAINTHLGDFELPPIASVHVTPGMPGPEVTVQLSCHEPSDLAPGLLAWADTLTQVTAEVWRVPRGDSVHLSVTGALPNGTSAQIYGALPYTESGLGRDLTPGGKTPITLGALRALTTLAEVRL
jgi:FtsP/CotA-like multicopper oxidase with cupredoxin domain